MTKITCAGAAVMIAISLAGCSAAAPKAETVKPSTSAAPALTADPTISPVEDEFFTATKRIPGLESVSMKDALKVGHYVCDQLAAGVSPLDITAIKNTDRANNEDMISVSTLTLCTDQIKSVQDTFAARDKAERIANGSDR
jgi:hypothetical protein